MSEPPVRRVRQALEETLAALPKLPDRVSVREGDAEIEVTWPVGDAVAAQPDPVPPAEPTAEPDAGPAGPRITAPSVGTFYRAPEPGAPPFVAEGDVVRVGQQVGIIEAMKLMLPVEADAAGQVVSALKADGAAVEYGEPLFVLAES